MRFHVLVVVVCLALSSQLSAQDQKNAKPPDQKAFVAARKIPDPQEKIDALHKFVAQYPKSSRAGSANRLILETLVKNFPKQTDEIQKQVGVELKNAKKDYYRYDDVASILADHDVLLPQAQAISEKSQKMLKESKFVADEKKGYERAKMKAPDPAVIHKDYLETHASLETTLGAIYLKVGKAAEGERLLRDAYAADPTDSEAAALLGMIDAKAGHDDTALQLLVRARLTGKLTSEQQSSLDDLYSKLHGNSQTGLEDYLDAQYEKDFPIPFKFDTYKPSAKRSKRTVLAELFTGSACGPCAGADLAIEADLKRYSRSDLAVLMFHQHIPEPDPMTNPASVQRFAYYQATGTPTIAIDGVTKIVGASRDGAKSSFNTIDKLVDQDLDEPAEASLTLAATRHGDTVHVVVHTGKIQSASKDLNLEIVLVENLQRYSGENGNRFHPMVVRSVANSDENGFSLDPAKPGTVEYSFDVSRISSNLKTYLDNYEQHNDRFGQITFIEKKYEIDPADLSVIAFVQDIKTKHVLQAAYEKVGGSSSDAVAHR
ncbi:MAG: hypothetical protein WA324_03180 [Bryobacteraceae bacterium]